MCIRDSGSRGYRRLGRGHPGLYPGSHFGPESDHAHLERTHAVSVKWLREQCTAGRFGVGKVEPAHQAADIFTKPFVDK
eukprot:7613832-Alexandrium_andersonii.AAC.1